MGGGEPGGAGGGEGGINYDRVYDSRVAGGGGERGGVRGV